jgi:hypothetical protein
MNPSIEKRYCCNAVAAAATRLPRRFSRSGIYSGDREDNRYASLVAEFAGETFVPRSNLGPIQTIWPLLRSGQILGTTSMIRKSGNRFSEKIMLKNKLELDDDSKISHPALADAVLTS